MGADVKDIYLYQESLEERSVSLFVKDSQWLRRRPFPFTGIKLPWRSQFP